MSSFFMRKIAQNRVDYTQELRRNYARMRKTCAKSRFSLKKNFLKKIIKNVLTNVITRSNI